VSEIRADHFSYPLVESVGNGVVGRASFNEEHDGDTENTAPHKLIGIFVEVYISFEKNAFAYNTRSLWVLGISPPPLLPSFDLNFR